MIVLEKKKNPPNYNKTNTDDVTSFSLRWKINNIHTSDFFPSRNQRARILPRFSIWTRVIFFACDAKLEFLRNWNCYFCFGSRWRLVVAEEIVNVLNGLLVSQQDRNFLKLLEVRIPRRKTRSMLSFTPLYFRNLRFSFETTGFFLVFNVSVTFIYFF